MVALGEEKDDSRDIAGATQRAEEGFLAILV
jgi:hypothetical protein